MLAAKRICNPVSPSNALSYFTDTIVGLAEYCEGFSTVEPTVEAIRSYVEGMLQRRGEAVARAAQKLSASLSQ